MSEQITEASEIGLRRSTHDHVGQMKAAPEVSGRCHTPLARIAIRVDGGTRFVSTDGVLVVRAQGNYVLLQVRIRFLCLARVDHGHAETTGTLWVCAHPSFRNGEPFVGGGNPALFDWRLPAPHERRKGIQGHKNL